MFSHIDKDNIVSPKGTIKRDKPLAELSREEVYSQKHATFGKLSFTDKLAFGAAAIAIENANFDLSNTTGGLSAGILLHTNIGSFFRDCEFMDSIRANQPSPALFSATLPSSPIAEIAIVFGLKGANKVIFCDNEGNDSPLSLAEKTANLMLAECSELLFVSINICENNIENSFADARIIF